MRENFVATRGHFSRQSAPQGDPVTVEIVRSGLVSAAEQMRIALCRTAFSPLIYEALDFCCALYDRQVRLLGQARVLPLFLGTMNFCIQACVEAVGGADALEPGDILFSTYAYDIGSHPQDAAVVMPVFEGDQLVGYAALKAHHMDLAAKDPYSTDTTDNFQEGVIFPGVKLFSRGELQPDLYRTLLANSRLPDEVAGDLSAEVIAARTGGKMLRSVIKRHGLETFEGAVGEMFDHGEKCTRDFLGQVPDGKYRARGAQDSDGLGDQAVEYEIGVEVSGSDVVIDFTQCPSEQAGPINCPLPTTVSAARFAIIAAFGSDQAVNEGHFRPIEVRTRRGSMFHPEPPAPIYMYGWPGFQAIDLIHRAFADAVPGLMPAGSGGDLCGITWWGTRPDGTFWVSETDHVTGQGASSEADGGPPVMHISCSGQRNTPVEVLEHRYPLRVHHCELATNSGGAGRQHGGPGIDICYEVLEDVSITSTMERTKTPPWGLLGGSEGRPNRGLIHYPDGSTRAIGKATDLRLPAGSMLEIRVGGGGGYGPPSERESEAITADVQEGYISEVAAKETYGVSAGSGART